MTAAQPSPPDPARLSLNQITIRPADLPTAVAACVDAGVGSIGVWRDKVAEVGVDAAAGLCADAGLRVSSLCRGGMFTAGSVAGRRAAVDENRRAVEEAAALEADVLVLVCGGVMGRGVVGRDLGRDLPAARGMVEDGIAALLPDAAAAGVHLGIEPLHPMFCADRSVVSTLGQANDLAERLDSPWVGVVVDAYHVWWDPAVCDEIARAAGRILGFHVSDWVTPLPQGVLTGRGLMGDGCIDLRGLRGAVEAAGYDGPIEAEIMNTALWERPADETLAAVRDRYLACV